MALIMGPVLGFRGRQGDVWMLSALAVLDAGDPPLSLTITDGDGRDVVQGATQLMRFGGRAVVRLDFDVQLQPRPRRISYKLGTGPNSWEIAIPALNQAPRMAYASCNGFSDPSAVKKVKDRNERWTDLNNRQKKNLRDAYHLLLMGGDQVYADSMWEIVPTLKAWAELSSDAKWNAPFPAKMKSEVEQFYFSLYCDRWSQPEPALSFASIPSLMMWDDHDIFDGWGSYADNQLDGAVYKNIFEIARRHFQVFQLRTTPNGRLLGTIGDQDGTSYFYQLGSVAVLGLDMRSERRINRVIGQKSWKAIFDRLEAFAAQPNHGCKHLYVLSSIPVVHPDLSLVERTFNILPGQQELEDDLKDHWHSVSHKQERIRLVRRLLDFSRDSRIRVTILSGDVHVGAVGVIESDRSGVTGDNANVINQLTSSAIVHPPPPALMAYALEFLSGTPETVDRGVTATLANFPGTSQKFIGARNWLGLEPDDTNRVWANWYIENKGDVYTKVINPVG